MSDIKLEEIARWIYEATRVEAEWSKRPIVPEVWEKRDDKFRNQFVDIIGEYLAMDKLPTPAEAHESWNQAYYKMGWKYGEVRDTEAKTHPDLVPFDELPQPEKDKDAIFLAFVWLAKQMTPPKQAGTTPSTELKKTRYYLRRELDKWDRVELELESGEYADFMATDFVLDKLTPVVEALITRERNKAYDTGYNTGYITAKRSFGITLKDEYCGWCGKRLTVDEEKYHTECLGLKARLLKVKKESNE